MCLPTAFISLYPLRAAHDSIWSVSSHCTSEQGVQRQPEWAHPFSNGKSVRRRALCTAHLKLKSWWCKMHKLPFLTLSMHTQTPQARANCSLQNSKKFELLFHLVQSVQKAHSVWKHEACGIFCLSYNCVSCIPTKQPLPHPATSPTLLIQAINLRCHRSHHPELARGICPLQVRWLRLMDWSFGFLRSDHLIRRFTKWCPICLQQMTIVPQLLQCNQSVIYHKLLQCNITSRYPEQ